MGASINVLALLEKDRTKLKQYNLDTFGCLDVSFSHYKTLMYLNDAQCGKM